MTFKPHSPYSVFINTTSMSQTVSEYVIDEIRERVNNAFLGEVISPRAVSGIEAAFRNVLKEMEQAGIITQPLTEQDIKGIADIMLLEWNIPNYEGPSHYDPTLKSRVTPVSVPDVRTICGALSDQALKAMTAPYVEFGDCDNAARFFFLEKLRREGAIVDWSFTWKDPQSRTGTLFISPKYPIQTNVNGIGDTP